MWSHRRKPKLAVDSCGSRTEYPRYPKRGVSGRSDGVDGPGLPWLWLGRMPPADRCTEGMRSSIAIAWSELMSASVSFNTQVAVVVGQFCGVAPLPQFDSVDLPKRSEGHFVHESPQFNAFLQAFYGWNGTFPTKATFRLGRFRYAETLKADRLFEGAVSHSGVEQKPTKGRTDNCVWVTGPDLTRVGLGRRATPIG